MYVTPKVGMSVTDKWSTGGGVIYATIPNFNSNSERFGIGIIYAVNTIGNSEQNITLGLGWGFSNNENMAQRPIITLSGMKRVGQKAALITENWIIPTDGYYPVLSYGVRFFGEKISVDLAFINSADIVQGLFIGIPFIDFAVKF